MKAHELARELGCTVSDLQRAARAIQASVPSPAEEVKRGDVQRLREEVLRQQQERALALAVQDPGADAEGAPARVERQDVLRTERAAPRGAGRWSLVQHLDFVEWLETATPAHKKRVALVIRHLLAHGHTSQVKSVRGPAAGWLRTPLGGTGGNQFYLWWVDGGRPLGRDAGLERHQILLRAVRHHDATSEPLHPSRADDWLELTAAACDEDAELETPFTEDQTEASRCDAAVRVIRGQPGTGKTTTLWLSTQWTSGARAIYITFSQRLARQTEEYLAAMGPKDMAIHVLTFDELVGELLQDPLPREDVSATIDRFARWAQTYRGSLGPWQDHLPELFAELHAHAVGRALPIAFRARPASAGPVVVEAAYVAGRREVIGEPAARIAGQVARRLVEDGQLSALLPSPVRARRALDGLDSGAPLTERLSRFDWLFVDEVQDLTLVEGLLLDELAARAGRQQDEPPGVVVAGDEGQTVRPTEFDWGELNDLLQAKLGKPRDLELRANVRAPRDLAHVVNNAAELYSVLDRSARPRGRARAEIDETSTGSIAYCQVADPADRARLLEALEAAPGTEVVYPGFSVPAELAEASVFTSLEAKGLDFQTVAVLDVGKRVTELQAQASGSGRTSDLHHAWARTAADQLRVALSRATENLVLVELSADEAAHRAVTKLCRSPLEDELTVTGYLGRLTVDEVLEHLQGEHLDRHARVEATCEEIERLVEDDPKAALRKARQATALLGRPSSPGAVIDPELRARTARLRGLSALLRALRPSEGDDVAAMFREASLHLRKADCRAAASASLALRDLGEAEGATKKDRATVAVELATSLAAVLDELPEAGRDVRGALVRWASALSAHPLPAGLPKKDKLLQAVAQLAELLVLDQAVLHEAQERLLMHAARGLMEERRWQDGLVLLRRLKERHPRLEGACHRELGELKLAIKAFRDAGAWAEARACARQRGNLVETVALFKQTDTPVPPSVQWASDALAMARARPPEGELTMAEREAVLKAFAKTLQLPLPDPGKGKGGR